VQATRLKAEKAPAGTPGPRALAVEHERATIEKIFEGQGLPGWVGWGIYGAESSYGKAKNDAGFGFGLIEPSYAGKSPRAGQTYYNAEIAAETVKGLLKTSGGLDQAIESYSGHEYSLSHIIDLGKVGKKPSGSFAEEHPGAGPEALGEPGLPEPSIGNPLNTLGDLIGLLTSGQTWLRLGEILGGALLLFLGLKGLTGAELPSTVPVPV
jgi:hypothetical protein